ncbi:MAG: DNA replication and repair protein RecF, partial [Bacteroidia bacterium]|nr:DNA replication and repair protein RecF [Bacteroidia bacterium]
YIQYTSVGVHKDDLGFTLEGYPVKKFGSQGQQKSFVIALKLAVFHLLKEKKNLKPIVLLDDIFDKLDNSRVTKLMDLVSNDTFGQLFVTDTDAKRIHEIFDHLSFPVKIFELDKMDTLTTY